MMSIIEAKKHLGDRYRHEEGFVGVRVCRQNGEDALCVYVVDPSFPIARKLKREGSFEGFPLEVEVTGEVRVLPL
jgi:hypothetical protein